MGISDFLLELVCNGNEEEKECEEEGGAKTRFGSARMSGGEEGGEEGWRSQGGEEEDFSLLQHSFVRPSYLSPQELSHRFFSHSSEFSFMDIPSPSRPREEVPSSSSSFASSSSSSSSSSPSSSSHSSFPSKSFEPAYEIKPCEGFSRPWYNKWLFWRKEGVFAGQGSYFAYFFSSFVFVYSIMFFSGTHFNWSKYLLPLGFLL